VVQADSGVQLGAARDIAFEGGQIVSDGEVSLVAGKSGTGSVLGGAGAGPDVVAGGDVLIQAPDAIGGSDALEVATDGELKLRGRLINADMVPLTPGHTAELIVTGLGGTMAQEVDLAIQGAGDVVLHTFVAGNAHVETDSPDLQVEEGNVGDWAVFNTPYFSARIDHQDRNASSGPDVRAFTLDGDFDLHLTPDIAWIGAYIINQDPRRIVIGNTPGYVDLENGLALRSLDGQDRGLPELFRILRQGMPIVVPTTAGLVQIDARFMDQIFWQEEAQVAE
jgi:hypothetical protein